MIAWLSSAGPWLIDFAWLVTALLAAATLLRQLLREPGSRVALAWATWAAVAAAAILTAIPAWPRMSMTQVLRATISTDPMEPASGTDLQIFAPLLADSLSLRQPESIFMNTMPPAEASWLWSDFAVLVWLACAGAALGWIVLGLLQARRLLRHSLPAPTWVHDQLQVIGSGQRRLPEVRLSSQLQTAVALGTRRPRILLPQVSVVEKQASAIRAALAHEWAHIRHRDLWLLALERLVLPLVAVHPLFWWLRGRTRLDQELLADAAAAGDKPLEYAEALMAWATAVPNSNTALAALGIWQQPSNLSRRMNMILSPQRVLSTRFGIICSLAAVGVLLLLVVGLSMITLRPLTANDEPLFFSITQTQGALAQPAEDSDLTALSPAKTQVGILLQCIVLEVNHETLAKAMSSDNQPQPSPPTRLTVQAASRWQSTLQVLRAEEGTKILARPQLITLNKTEGRIEIAASEPAVEDGEASVVTPLKIRLKPALTDGDQRVQLSAQLEQGAPLKVSAAEGQLATRRLEVDQSIPLGTVLIAVHAPPRQNLRPLVFAIEPRIVPLSGVEISGEDRVSLEQLKRSLDNLARERDERSKEADALRQKLKQMGRELDRLRSQSGPSTAPTTPVPPAHVLPPRPVEPLIPHSPLNAAARRARLMEVRLLELDLAEARLELEDAEAELTRAKEMREKGLMPEQEFRQRHLKVERTKIQMERIKVRLEAAHSADDLVIEPPPR